MKTNTFMFLEEFMSPRQQGELLRWSLDNMVRNAVLSLVIKELEPERDWGDAITRRHDHK